MKIKITFEEHIISVHGKFKTFEDVEWLEDNGTSIKIYSKHRLDFAHAISIYNKSVIKKITFLKEK